MGLRGKVLKNRISNFSSDDDNLVELFKIHMLFTPLWIILVLQYLPNPSLMMVKILVLA